MVPGDLNSWEKSLLLKIIELHNLQMVHLDIHILQMDLELHTLMDSEHYILLGTGLEHRTLPGKG